MDVSVFRDFFIACIGASASFIGLLFVALSVVLARKEGTSVELEFTERRLAESSFTALANIFFIALVALIPGTNIGYVVVPVAIFGLYASWRLSEHSPGLRKNEDGVWIGLSFFIYAVQGFYGVMLVIDPGKTSDLYVVAGILVGLFCMGLVRSWRLTGIRVQ